MNWYLVAKSIQHLLYPELIRHPLSLNGGRQRKTIDGAIKVQQCKIVVKLPPQ